MVDGENSNFIAKLRLIKTLIRTFFMWLLFAGGKLAFFKVKIMLTRVNSSRVTWAQKKPSPKIDKKSIFMMNKIHHTHTHTICVCIKNMIIAFDIIIKCTHTHTHQNSKILSQYVRGVKNNVIIINIARLKNYHFYVHSHTHSAQSCVRWNHEYVIAH